MNAKISLFAICLESMIYLLAYSLHDCTFNDTINLLQMFVEKCQLFNQKNQ